MNRDLRTIELRQATPQVHNLLDATGFRSELLGFDMPESPEDLAKQTGISKYPICKCSYSLVTDRCLPTFSHHICYLEQDTS